MGILRVPGSWFRVQGSWFRVPGSSLFSHGVREDVLERRHAGTKMPYLRLLGGRDREQLALAGVAWHEHAHDVFVGCVAVETGGAKSIEERFEIRGGLDPQLIHA